MSVLLFIVGGGRRRLVRRFVPKILPSVRGEVKIRPGAPEIPRHGFKSTDSGIDFVLRYDIRDNIFTPGRGVNLEAAGTFLVSWLGSDNADRDYTVTGHFYWNVHPSLVLVAWPKAETVVGGVGVGVGVGVSGGTGVAVGTGGGLAIGTGVRVVVGSGVTVLLVGGTMSLTAFPTSFPTSCKGTRAFLV